MEPAPRPSGTAPAQAPSSAPDPGTGAAAAGEDRVLTVPNAVTALRLAGIGVFVWLLFGAAEQTAAAIVLGALGATDWVDGQLARRLHQVSTVGKVLDPAADRLLVGTAVISIIVHGAVPLWFGLLTVAREALVSAMVLLLAALGARRIDVLWVGKVATLGLMVAYPGFLISYGSAGWQQPFHVAAWIFGGVGLALAWVAAVAYVRPARAALAAGRRGRDVGRAGRRGARTGEVGA